MRHPVEQNRKRCVCIASMCLCIAKIYHSSFFFFVTSTEQQYYSSRSCVCNVSVHDCNRFFFTLSILICFTFIFIGSQARNSLSRIAPLYIFTVFATKQSTQLRAIWKLVSEKLTWLLCACKTITANSLHMHVTRVQRGKEIYCKL